ncbi:hypothetical protein IAG44_23250 [Streptomyces roseirectus]|uniref:Protein kilB n=1 Tax=Streptomyces roseirectus TaxID=2768066 RepID=A0A7H0IGX8_9ACTN|nr:hypothetical protein [Streptomyces roseirectus]QNP72044.1 hypothetical protein IAG44_23250 [Streptomyces roseirectus]
METLAASLIAVLGTLLGAGLTHRFQVRATERTERFARDERARAERMDVYSAYAGALVNYRRALVDRWFREHEDGPGEEVTAARMNGYELRSVVQEALFRVQMVAPDDKLVELAREALHHIDQLHKAPDRDEMDARRDSTRARITGFVSAAKETL